MLSQQRNELLARVGSDTPAGELLRSHRYSPSAVAALKRCRGAARKATKRYTPDFILTKICRFEPGLIGLSRRRALSRSLMGQMAAAHGWKVPDDLIRELAGYQTDRRTRSCLAASLEGSTHAQDLDHYKTVKVRNA